MTESMLRALIVAFDDVLVPTQAVRAAALHEACAAEGLNLPFAWAEAATTHRSLADVIHAGIPGTTHDPALSTVIGLRAHDRFAARMAGASTLDPAVIRTMDMTLASGGRVIVRADAPRDVVTRALAVTHLPDALAFLVCDDDPGASPLQAAWARIDERLQRVGIPIASRGAMEVRPDAQQLAARYAWHTVAWNSTTVRRFPSV